MIKALLIVFIITNIISASIVIVVVKRHYESSKVDCAKCEHCRVDIGFSRSEYRYNVDNVCPLGRHDQSPLSCVVFERKDGTV